MVLAWRNFDFATGVLSEPYIPDFKEEICIKGLAGTSNWPDTPMGLADKKVGVIGTGATAVQLITEISKNIGSLTVSSGLLIIVSPWEWPDKIRRTRQIDRISKNIRKMQFYCWRIYS